MRIRVLSGVLAFGLFAGALASCSNSYCSTVVNSGNILESKLGSCDADAGFNFTTHCTSAAEAQCNTAFSHCSSADQAVLNAQANCINNLPTCTPSTAASWGTQLVTCLTDAGEPSLNCAESFAAEFVDAGGCSGGF
jgi:hypothetical protein